MRKFLKEGSAKPSDCKDEQADQSLWWAHIFISFAEPLFMSCTGPAASVVAGREDQYSPSYVTL